MSSWDKKYIKLCEEILEKGTEVKNRTGINTIKLPYKSFSFDLSKEFPILTVKKVNFDVAVIEMLWFYQAKSNDVRWLNERNIKLWDNWAVDEDGYYRVYNKDGSLKYEKFFGKKYAHTIGTAYGYINKIMKQPETAIEIIKAGEEDPRFRRNIINLWQDEYLKTAVLPSCVFNLQLDVTDGKLNGIVTQRSCDVALGLPFNVAQYAVLIYMLAQVTNLKPGMLYWSAKDVHIYVNQIDGIKTQIERMKTLGGFKAPKLYLNPEIKDFFAFDNSRELKDIKLINYQHHGSIKMEIAV